MIKHIHIENFVIIENLDIDCEGKSVYIVGENGSGKTVLLQAISLALTGKTAKKLTNKSYIGPYGNDFKIELTLDDGTYIKRCSSSGELTLPDGSSYNKISDIYSALPFDTPLLFNVAYVKQGEISELFDSGKNIMDKLAALVIDFDKFKTGYSDLNKDLKLYTNHKIHYEQLLNTTNTTDLENEIQSINAEIIQLKSQINQWKASTTMSIQELQEQQKFINNESEIKQYIDHYQMNLKTLNEQTVKKPKDDIDTIKTKKQIYDKWLEVSDSKNKLDNMIKQVNIAKQNIKLLELLFTVDTTLVKNKYTTEQLSTITQNKALAFKYMTTEEHTTDINAQSLMKFVVNTYHINDQNINLHKQMWAEIQNHTNEINSMNDVITLLKNNNITVGDIPKALATIEERATTNINILIETLKQFNGVEPEPVTDVDVFRIESEHKDYAKYISDIANIQTKIKTYSDDLKKVQKKIIISEDDINNFKNIQHQITMTENMINDKTKYVAHLQKQISDLQQTETDLTKTINTIERITNWKEILKDFPSKIRKELFQPIVNYINNDFYSLFSFTNLGKVTIDWDKFNIFVGDKTTEMLSGAQQCTFSLCVRLALLKTIGQNIPIMLADEPTAHLDVKRKQELRNFFSYLNSFAQMFISTHDEDIIDKTQSIVINTSDW